PILQTLSEELVSPSASCRWDFRDCVSEIPLMAPGNGTRDGMIARRWVDRTNPIHAALFRTGLRRDAEPDRPGPSPAAGRRLRAARVLLLRPEVRLPEGRLPRDQPAEHELPGGDHVQLRPRRRGGRAGA